jgi:antirestriction protein
LKIFLTNLGKYNEGDLVGRWLTLPCTLEERNTALSKIGIGEQYEEYFITDYENDVGLFIDQFECLSELNEIAKSIACLNAYQRNVLRAVIQLEPLDLCDIVETVNNLSNYTLHTNIQTDYDLGHYHIHEIGKFNIDVNGEIAKYIDYEAYGRDIRLNSKLGFASDGWLEYSD